MRCFTLGALFGLVISCISARARAEHADVTNRSHRAHDPRHAGLSAEEYACLAKRDRVESYCPTASQITLDCCDMREFLASVQDRCAWVKQSTYSGMGFFTRRSFLSHCNSLRRRFVRTEDIIFLPDLEWGASGRPTSYYLARFRRDNSPSIGAAPPSTSSGNSRYLRASDYCRRQCHYHLITNSALPGVGNYTAYNQCMADCLSRELR